MTLERFHQIAARYATLQVGVVGDFCLDRYFEIDPARAETSIETGLVVHNVINIRAQAGAAGTIVNNLAALGVGGIPVVGFCGVEGEGFELEQALRATTGVDLEHFVRTPERKTFVYGKPVLINPPLPPSELSRLDIKNWTKTPEGLKHQLIAGMKALFSRVDAIVLMDQVSIEETGVVTHDLIETAASLLPKHPKLVLLADSRRGGVGDSRLGIKMNESELARFANSTHGGNVESIKAVVAQLAEHSRQPVFVTLAERGIVGALADGRAEHVRGFPVRGPIDVVGAGDAVSANLAVALAAGASLREAMRIAMAAASIVVHKLGTTGTASLSEIAGLLDSQFETE
jgi:rfaE bifunctional protein kinase chain/domain